MTDTKTWDLPTLEALFNKADAGEVETLEALLLRLGIMEKCPECFLGKWPGKPCWCVTDL